mgnify:FL=1
MEQDKTVIVGSIKDAAHAGYAQGFQEGYQAACMVVKAVAEAWRKEPYAYDLDGAVKALEMSREKAVAMMGTPSFEVNPAPVQPMPDTVN